MIPSGFNQGAFTYHVIFPSIFIHTLWATSRQCPSRISHCLPIQGSPQCIHGTLELADPPLIGGTSHPIAWSGANLIQGILPNGQPSDLPHYVRALAKPPSECKG